jgi:nitrogen-specific signal transduction histidine kinase
VLGQEAQIEQVFVNLIDNAIHAMKSVTNPRALTVSLTHNEFAVTITVDDTGSGINNDVRDRIFDPFYTTRKIGEGLGLGLAIVHIRSSSNTTDQSCFSPVRHLAHALSSKSQPLIHHGFVWLNKRA